MGSSNFGSRSLVPCGIWVLDPSNSDTNEVSYGTFVSPGYFSGRKQSDDVSGFSFVSPSGKKDDVSGGRLNQL